MRCTLCSNLRCRSQPRVHSPRRNTLRPSAAVNTLPCAARSVGKKGPRLWTRSREPGTPAPFADRLDRHLQQCRDSRVRRRFTASENDLRTQRKLLTRFGPPRRASQHPTAARSSGVRLSSAFGASACHAYPPRPPQDNEAQESASYIYANSQLRTLGVDAELRNFHSAFRFASRAPPCNLWLPRLALRAQSSRFSRAALP